MSLKPISTLVWINSDGVQEFPPDQPLPDDVGGKARGLLGIPSAWTPKFVVVSPDLVREYSSALAQGRAQVIARWSERIQEALDRVGIGTSTAVYIRSNSATESIRDRGSYSSRVSQPGKLAEDLTLLLGDLFPASVGTPMGLIVQEYVAPLLYGHLSNERRVAREHRDAEVLTVVAQTGALIETRIAHRNWRRSGRADEDVLSCTSHDDIKDVLREPLVFAAQNGKRINYEWVWAGNIVYIVQADLAQDNSIGTSPNEVLGQATQPPTDLELSSFRVAVPTDVGGVGKLRSHMRYKAAGFWQPVMYVLDDEAMISSIMDGSPAPTLLEDLGQLVCAPLMIRTCYSAEDIQLLPRSELLTTTDAALAWLTGDFATAIKEKGLHPAAVSLLAHHYIPALGAAFSSTRPGHRSVLIEALWGVPEGLYYYPCDEFQVMAPLDLPAGESVHGFSVQRRRVQFKSHFVAPDPNGRFRRYQLGQPWDWKPTVSKSALLCRIAKFTRALADQEGAAVNVMWFLGCRTSEGVKDAIPWYQAKQEWPEDDNTFRRNARDFVFSVSTEADLETLERGSLQLPLHGSGRLVIHLSPSDHIALRDESFARRVGDAAASRGAVVVLNGARLAHIYYVLARTGAEIVTRPLWEEEDLHEDFVKLVRDKIPEKVVMGGESVRVANLSPAERLVALKIKLIEEAYEVRDASPATLIEELADVQEVLRALIRAAGLSVKGVEEVRRKKAAKRGGFDEGILLLKTAISDTESSSVPLLQQDGEAGSQRLRTTKAPSLERIKAGGSDRRTGAEFVEFVRDMAVSISIDDWSVDLGPLYFGDLQTDVASASVEAHRRGTELRLRIKIRIGEEQFELPLPLSSAMGNDSSEGADSNVR